MGTRFEYESQELTISLVGESEVVCTRRSGSPVTLSRDWLSDALRHKRIVLLTETGRAKLDLARYDQAQLDIALQRRAILQSDTPPAIVCDRTVRRWLARQNAVLLNGGHEVLALVPHTDARGNRTARLTEAQDELLNNIIETHWRSHKAINYKACCRSATARCGSRTHVRAGAQRIRP